MAETITIQGFHAHVYFDPTTQNKAERVRDALAERFAVTVGRVHPAPVGPHTKGMFEVCLAPEQFASVVTWLMFHREGLSVLVHPNTDDPVADHEANPLWLGAPVAIDVDVIRRLIAQTKSEREQTKER